MDIQKQAQTSFAGQENKIRPKRRFIIVTIIMAALIVATALALSSLGIIPGFLAIIISAFAAVFSVVFTLLPLIPSDNKADVSVANPTSFVIPEIKIQVHAATSAQLTSPTTDLVLSPIPTIWMVPYYRNPLFTGRRFLLQNLHDQLLATRTTALTQAQAINGLGGVGKSQIAIEYAFRYRQDYKFVFWARAATKEMLIADFVSFARHLQLPEQHKQEQQYVAAAFKEWMIHHTDWLLILDNVEDLTLFYEFIPSGTTGHIIFTTRSQLVGPHVRSIEVKEMDPDEATLLLLRRARLLAPDTPIDQISKHDRALAQNIANELGGLPLALDQAGAYIEETKSSLSDYLERYQQQQTILLLRRGTSGTDHPDPITITWSISFEQVERLNLIAADLLRFCAFLAPDAIPEELIREGANELGPILQPLATNPTLFDEAISILRRYSFIRRNPEQHILSIHRLVQVVLRARMSKSMQSQWAERTIRAVNKMFPTVNMSAWSQCERLFPQAQTCAKLISHYKLYFPEAIRLIDQVATYLKDNAFYSEAEELFRHNLDICELVFGPTNPITAVLLNNLAVIYEVQGKFKKAVTLHQKALKIREQELGPMHPDTAQSLNNLALLYYYQGKFKQAEPLSKRAVAIDEQVYGFNAPETTPDVNNLGLIYEALEQYEKAEPLYQRTLHITEQTFGPMHPDTARSLNNLAGLYRRQGKLEQAELLMKRALDIDEQAYGPNHPETATDLHNIAELYSRQGKLEQAELLMKRALDIREQKLGPVHSFTALSLNNLALLHQKMGKLEQAEPIYKQALSIQEQTLDPAHPDIAGSLSNLALLYYYQKKFYQAEPLLKRALDIYKQVFGPTSHHTIQMQEIYTILLNQMKRKPLS